MKISLFVLAVSFVLVSCGTDEQPIVNVPAPEKPIIVDKPVIVEKEIQPKTKEVTVCHVLLTDSRGNVSRLSVDDLFLRNTELARQFSDDEATHLISVKQCKVIGTLSKFCFTKTVRE